jgi:hypothetical protein
LNGFADAAEVMHHHANEAADLIGTELNFRLWAVKARRRTGGGAAAGEHIEAGRPDLLHGAVRAERC